MPRKSCVGPSSYSEQRVGSCVRAPVMRSRSRGLLGAALLAVPILSGCPLSEAALPVDAGSSCATSLTVPEFNTWFETGSVSLDGVVKPANSVAFPDVPNCSFYKWSEQMFLWLTSPAPPRYGGGDRVMNSPAFFDVSLPDESDPHHRHFVPHQAGLIRAFNLRTAQRGALDLPVVLEKGTLRMVEILPPVMSRSGKQMVLNGDGNEVEIGAARLDREGRPVLLDPSGKAIPSPRAILGAETERALREFEASGESRSRRAGSEDSARRGRPPPRSVRTLHGSGARAGGRRRLDGQERVS